MINNVLIVGGNFNNKGAQSMLFITVDELKKHGVQNIMFGSNELVDMTPYTFKHVFLNYDSQRYILSRNAISRIVCGVIEFGRFFLKRNKKNLKYRDLSKVLPKTDLIIDISGFGIGKKWSKILQKRYLNNIRLAQKFNIPIILMPQSFGGFDYNPKEKILLKDMAELLQIPCIIFARESQGYNDLVRTFNLSNVVLSTDLVLQNKGIELSNIYKEIPKLQIPKVKPNAVGIIPNKQCISHGDETVIIDMYRAIIAYLQNEGKEIYIFRHSKEDLAMCEKIYTSIPSKSNVHLMKNDFSCVEYDAFVKQFSFIICSRYHGIVHAYRNSVPAILLGWETKYMELAKKMMQEQYSFDITSKDLDVQKIIAEIRELSKNCLNEKRCISTCLTEIQEKNCFQQVFKMLK